MAKKTDKTHKLRGSREHGRGMKKGRGAGLRGGKGGAGWKHKKLHFLLYEKDRIRGKHGFIRHAQDTAPEISITVQHVDERASSWAQEGKAGKQDNGFTIDLVQLGFDKLVGTGKVTQKLALTVPRASPSAVEKIQAAGGTVTQTNPPEPEAPAPAAGGKGPKGPPPAGGKPASPPPAAPKAPKEARPRGGEGAPTGAAPKGPPKSGTKQQA